MTATPDKEVEEILEEIKVVGDRAEDQARELVAALNRLNDLVAQAARR